MELRARERRAMLSQAASYLLCLYPWAPADLRQSCSGGDGTADCRSWSAFAANFRRDGICQRRDTPGPTSGEYKRCSRQPLSGFRQGVEAGLHLLHIPFAYPQLTFPETTLLCAPGSDVASVWGCEKSPVAGTDTTDCYAGQHSCSAQPSSQAKWVESTSTVKCRKSFSRDTSLRPFTGINISSVCLRQPALLHSLSHFVVLSLLFESELWGAP